MITIPLILALFKLLTMQRDREKKIPIKQQLVTVLPKPLTKVLNPIFLTIVLLLPLFAASQKTTASLTSQNSNRNSIDITIGGTGLFLSTNYNRVLFVQPGYFVNASVGIGAVIIAGGLTLPHQLTMNFGKKNSFLEVGIGGSYWTGKDDSVDPATAKNIHSYNISPILGWRKNISKHFVFRIYASPLIHISGEYIANNQAITAFGGLSFGYSF